MKVAFIGHRKIEQTFELKEKLTNEIERLIVNDNADTFLFGSKSEFNDLCYEVVSNLKSKYVYIQRVFVRAEYEFIDKSYSDYLLTLYEDTFFPIEVQKAGMLSYIKRNQVMIDMSDVLVTFCNPKYILVSNTRSGTKIAVDYALKKKKRIINLFE